MVICGIVGVLFWYAIRALDVWNSLMVNSYEFIILTGHVNQIQIIRPKCFQIRLQGKVETTDHQQSWRVSFVGGLKNSHVRNLNVNHCFGNICLHLFTSMDVLLQLRKLNGYWDNWWVKKTTLLFRMSHFLPSRADHMHLNFLGFDLRLRGISWSPYTTSLT